MMGLYFVSIFSLITAADRETRQMKQKYLHLEENSSRLWKMFVTVVLYQYFRILSLF